MAAKRAEQGKARAATAKAAGESKRATSAVPNAAPKPALAGYSGTPLPKKLGIKENHRVALVRPPAQFDETLGELPPGVQMQAGLAGKTPLDVIVVFIGRRAELETQLASLRARMAQAGGLWVAWPKRASGVATDMTEDVVRDVALPTGLVDNKVCAIDETWSGLRLVIRLEHRR